MFGSFLFDHIDVRVRHLGRGRPFYDALCEEFGLACEEFESHLEYLGRDDNSPYIVLTEDAGCVASSARVALRATSRDHVDRVAAAVRRAGALEFEETAFRTEYAREYYATFFADPDGNRYEVCYKPHQKSIARLWRARIRPGTADQYRQYVLETGMADYSGVPGNRAALLLMADHPSHCDVLTLSLWSSMEAIKEFAGDPPEKARYYPDDKQFLLEFPDNVEHFSVSLPSDSKRTG